MTDDPVLNRAILHLLLQVAWADLEISSEEVEHVLAMAESAELGRDEIDELRACLAGEKPLPMPDLGLLREHKKTVLLAVGKLMAADNDIDSDEKEVFDQIRDMLG